MLVDLRRCIAAGACTVSCAIENQTPQANFVAPRQPVSKYRLKASKALPTSCCRGLSAVIVIIPCAWFARYKPLSREDGIVVVDNTLRGLRLLRAGLPL